MLGRQVEDGLHRGRGGCGIGAGELRESAWCQSAFPPIADPRRGALSSDRSACRRPKHTRSPSTRRSHRRRGHRRGPPQRTRHCQRRGARRDGASRRHRNTLDRQDEPVYGVSTGFGSLARVRIPIRAAHRAPEGACSLARVRDGSADRARGRPGDDGAPRADARDGLVRHAAGRGTDDRGRPQRPDHAGRP